MSKNSSRQSEHELSCLEFVKSMLLCNSELYFGLVDKDRKEFESIIQAAQQNTKGSRFPDFVFENGFIEHFQITSSAITEKGATHTKKESEFHRKVENEKNEIESEWSKTASFETVRSKSWRFSYPQHSHDLLVKSFQANWEKHMNSYGKYEGAKEVGVFMIEYAESALAMCENVYQDWISGMTNGDMRKYEQFNEYRLSRDKMLLEYVYLFREAIKYVIFLNYERIEIFRTENIKHLIKLMPWDYAIEPLQQATTVASVYNVGVSVDPKQGM